MKEVPLRRLREKMRLAEPVFYHGVKLIEAGIPLTRRKIEILQKLFDPSTVWLVLERGEELPSALEEEEEPSSSAPGKSQGLMPSPLRRRFLVPDLFLEHPVPENLLATRSLVLEAARSARGEPHISPFFRGPEAETFCFSILEELTKVKDILVNLERCLAREDLFRHTVNTGVLALAFAYALGEDRESAKRLGAGALVHDVGKTQKREPFFADPEVGHPVWGFAFLRAFPNLGIVPLYITLQHHEWYNGDGYPRGLRGTEIIGPARMLAVVDYYDWIFSTILASGEGNRVLEAANRVLQEEGKRLDSRLVGAFLRASGLLGKNSLVQISSGEVGVVLRENSDPLRPVVRLVFGKEGSVISFRDCNLALEDLRVTRIVVPPSLLLKNKEGSGNF